MVFSLKRFPSLFYKKKENPKRAKRNAEKEKRREKRQKNQIRKRKKKGNFVYEKVKKKKKEKDRVRKREKKKKKKEKIEKSVERVLIFSMKILKMEVNEMRKFVVVKEDIYGHITVDVMPSVEAMTLAQALAGELGLIADEDGYYDGNGNNIWLFPLGDGVVIIDEKFLNLNRLVSIKGSTIDINGQEGCSLVWTEIPRFCSPLDDDSGETTTGFVTTHDTWADLLDLFEKGVTMKIASEEEMRKLLS